MKAAMGWLSRCDGFWIRNIIIASVLAIPALAQGADAPPFPTPKGITQLPEPPITGVNGLEEFLCILLVWLFWGLIVLAVVMSLVAAYKYATSGGEPEKTSSAGKTLLYAAIAVAVALLAAGIPSLVISFFGGQNVQGACPSAFGG